MARWADAAILAFQTLTRFPTPPLRQAPAAETAALSGVFYPLAGAAVGAVGLGVFWATSSGFPLEAKLVAVWGAMTLATGALHEDGLADTADAFGSQRMPEDRMRVLKDSRVGTYGACALILLYLARIELLAAAAVPSLVVAGAFSRAGAVGLAWGAGPAGTGMGAGFAAAVQGRHVAGAVAWAAVFTLALPAEAAPRAAAGALLSAALAAAAVPYFRARLGGVVGDSLGAYVVVSELVVLASFAWG